MEIQDLLAGLAEITSTPGNGCTRLGYSDLENRAHDFVWENLKHIAALVRTEDAAGNLFVVPESASQDDHPGVLLIGSHLDTVINGGALDGALGVAAAMMTLSKTASNGSAHPNVGLVVFRDEEGVRFNTGLFGSKVFAGLAAPNDLCATDEDGFSVEDVVPDGGGCLSDYRPPVSPIGFLECHIEQGAKLEELGVDIGVVTSIVGIRRFQVVSLGEANHAGTTEMFRRKDALVAVAGLLAKLPSLVEDVEHSVITCGALKVEPGAPNVVPGKVVAVVEIRAPTEEGLDAVEEKLTAEVTAADVASDEVRISMGKLVKIPSTKTDLHLMEKLRGVLRSEGISHIDIPSMAGHDTQYAAYRCPSGMFFIPSVNGISHNPKESSKPEHVAVAAQVMEVWVNACLNGVAR